MEQTLYISNALKLKRKMCKNRSKKQRNNETLKRIPSGKNWRVKLFPELFRRLPSIPVVQDSQEYELTSKRVQFSSFLKMTLWSRFFSCVFTVVTMGVELSAWKEKTIKSISDGKAGIKNSQARRIESAAKNERSKNPEIWATWFLVQAHQLTSYSGESGSKPSLSRMGLMICLHQTFSCSVQESWKRKLWDGFSFKIRRNKLA